jgi:hypothetical protein
MPYIARVQIDLPARIRLHQVAILGDWRERFARSLEASGLADLQAASDLLPALFDEMLDLLEESNPERIPCSHRPASIGRLAPFPTNISVGLKLLNAGEAAIRAFLLDSCPAFRLEPEIMAESFLRDLNKATHILIHREIQGICEQSLRPITELYERVEGGDDRRQRQAPDQYSTIQSI